MRYAMAEYHENYELLTDQTRDEHRALKSLQEELEAVDWYTQRAQVCADESLRQILIHNRDEEIEHASMLLEWLRRNMQGWDEKLKAYLFTQKPMIEIEKQMEKMEAAGETNPPALLKIGNLKG